MSPTICFAVRQSHAKKVKDALDDKGILDRTQRTEVVGTGLCHIPTTVPALDALHGQAIGRELKETLTKELGLVETTDEISWFVGTTRPSASRQIVGKGRDPRIASAIGTWARKSPLHLDSRNISIRQLLDEGIAVHALYRPLLILHKEALASKTWTELIGNFQLSLLQDLYQEIASAFGVTHIAINGPIPLAYNEIDNPSRRPNVLRSPSLFQPVFGDFGKLLSRPPAKDDLSRTLWVATKQNDIFQCWAPLYSMFSQGNVGEKHRLLRFIRENRQEISPSESTAVDLYAGIGYFAFSYAKAGFEKVICWELNPWSVEGLRRGAAKNKWAVLSIQGDSVEPDDSWRLDLKGQETIVAFEEDNAQAARRIRTLRQQIPPVRHVNCGLLPTSRAVWEDALAILDPSLGGWIHVHENIANGEREIRTDEILDWFRHCAKPRTIENWHLQSVKPYAPGITHCALDLQIASSQLGNVL